MVPQAQKMTVVWTTVDPMFGSMTQSKRIIVRPGEAWEAALKRERVVGSVAYAYYGWPRLREEPGITGEDHTPSWRDRAIKWLEK